MDVGIMESSEQSKREDAAKHNYKYKKWAWAI